MLSIESNLIKGIGIGLIFLFGFFVGCNNSNEKEIFTEVLKTEVQIDTVFTQITDTIPKYIPKIEEKIKYIPDTIVDTVFVIEEFYTKNVYLDTIKNDYGHIIVLDTIYKNSIYSRSIQSNFLFPEVHKSTIITVVEKQRRFGGYVIAGGNFTDGLITLPVLGVGLQYKIVPNMYLGGEYNLLENDFRINLDYDNRKISGLANYSIVNKRLILGTRIKLF